MALGTLREAAKTSSGNSKGKSFCLIMDKISRPTSPRLPKISVTLPSALRCSWGHSVISTTTFCPSLALLKSRRMMYTSWPIRLSSGVTKAKSPVWWNTPTTLLLAWVMIRKISPSGFLPWVSLLTRAKTLSLFIAPFKARGGIKTSGRSPLLSGITKPKPLLVSWNRPATRPIFSGKP